MADYLSPKYHVVVANPPYMGGRGMNGRLGGWTKDNFPDSKADLFAAFIERGLDMIPKRGFSAMVTMESWMFLSSFEKLRTKLLSNTTIQCMVHMPYLGKGGTSMGINFGTTACVTEKISKADFAGRFCCVRHFETDDNGVPHQFPPHNERLCSATTDDFRKIPGSPIAYWASPAQRKAFVDFPSLGSWCPVKQGLATANNDLFVRLWHEVEFQKVGLNYTACISTESGVHKWFPYNKGGNYRRWYGNAEHVVNWENDGQAIRNFADSTGYIRSRAQNTEYYFKKGVTWTFISSSNFGVRMTPIGFIFDVAGSSAFPLESSAEKLTAFLGSCVTWAFLKLMNPTLNFQVGNIAALPVDPRFLSGIPNKVSKELISVSELDWNANETAWDFTALPLLDSARRGATLAETWGRLYSYWRGMTKKVQQLEEESNRIFIEGYGLQDELSPDVPLEEITLTCNPAHRYGGKKDESYLEKLLRADTIAEFLSYAVGCMFGRYSLDTPGLILANQGDALEDYLAKVPNSTFMPDADNVIPVLEGEWFAKDITERFRKFLRITFGDEHFQENLAFIEQALGKDVRRYFTRDFFNDHVQRYKKRPIYWMFSSPKGTFNALIYMHRYRPDTVNVVLNEYLRTFRSQLEAHKIAQERLSISTAATPAQRTAAIKDVQTVTKQIGELDVWERDVIYPLATQRLEIDLDDGVKVNYAKFAGALKPIKGLEEAED